MRLISNGLGRLNFAVNIPAIVVAAGVLICTTFVQAAPPPGSIKLLPGYHHEKLQGIDSDVGQIWKEGGLKIRYDIGQMAGNYTECKTCDWTSGEVWRKKQMVDGQEVVLVYTNAKRLIISFPREHANFYATAQTESDIADMLLMILTYDGSAKKRR